jgi:hypothetical protein
MTTTTWTLLLWHTSIHLPSICFNRARGAKINCSKLHESHCECTFVRDRSGASHIGSQCVYFLPTMKLNSVLVILTKKDLRADGYSQSYERSKKLDFSQKHTLCQTKYKFGMPHIVN